MTQVGQRQRTAGQTNQEPGGDGNRRGRQRRHPGNRRGDGEGQDEDPAQPGESVAGERQQHGGPAGVVAGEVATQPDEEGDHQREADQCGQGLQRRGERHRRITAR